MMGAKIRFAAVVMAAVAVSVGIGVAWAQQGAATDAPATAPPAPADVVVLDTFGIWRIHCTLAPPVLASGESVKLKLAWLNYKTPGPAKGWQATDFDDSSWSRGPVGLTARTPLLARVCLRGKFTVTNPAAVKDMKLSVTYRGGLIVYLNGKELHREHITKGKSVADGPVGEERNLTDYAIPARLLKKGMNVIGLEVVRGSYPASEEEPAKRTYDFNACELLSVRLTAGDGSAVVANAVRPEGIQVWNADPMQEDYDLDFGNQAEGVRPVRIDAARNGLFTGKVVVGSTEPIRGLKASISELTGPGRSVPASAVRIQYGVRHPLGEVVIADRNKDRAPYPTWPELIGGLAPEPLEEYGVTNYVPHRVHFKQKDGVATSRIFYKQAKRGSWPHWHGGKGVLYKGGGVHRYCYYSLVPKALRPRPSAVAPVWLTVKVPDDTAAGTYTGTLKIEVRGEKSVQVPVELRVADYTLPDKGAYHTWVDMIQSPDTLAMEYNVPLWSDKHFKLIDQSLRMIGEAGGRILYVPLIAHTNIGNEESMVRWVKKGDGYTHDFSVMERYLDAAEKHMGKPRQIVFLVWDVYMMPKNIDSSAGAGGHRVRLTAENLNKKGGTFGQGPMVTVVNAETGTTENVHLPTHFDPETSKPLWKPLFDELHKRLRKRGLDDAMMLGLLYDAWATKEEVAFFKDVAGDVPWAMHSHEGFPRNKLIYGIGKIGYQARVWTVYYSDDGAWSRRGHKPTIKSHHGWSKTDAIVTNFARWPRGYHPSTRWRHLPEASITGEQTGLGRLGGDMWRVMKDKRGRRMGRAFKRYPESDWRNLIIVDDMLAPGARGPIETHRHIALREGVQECEARIAIERALKDEALREKLGPKLVKRCETYLHDRHMMLWLSLSNLQFPKSGQKKQGYMASSWRTAPNVSGHNWFLSSGWQERTAKLFDLAGEVTRKLNGK